MQSVPATVQSVPAAVQSQPKTVTVKTVNTKSGTGVKNNSAPRGFNPSNQFTKKKLLTCAVCVAAAGALLVPLVAYSVAKNK